MPSRYEQNIELPTSKATGLLANKGSKLAVICTHPWGPLGGNLNNNVVTAVVLYFQKINITTLRFDFVGSQISRGLYQVAQVEEAARFLLSLPETPPQYILLIGYSYGSLIAGSASATIQKAVACIQIAPPFSVKHWLLLFHSNFHVRQAQKRISLPRLLILGTHDNFTTEDTFRRMIQTYPSASTTGAVLKGVDHFFSRREKDLMDIIGIWILQTFRINSLQALATIDFVSLGEDSILRSEENYTGDPYGCGVLTGATCTNG